jgi:Na+/H+-dicarboxylate symporter
MSRQYMARVVKYLKILIPIYLVWIAASFGSKFILGENFFSSEYLLSAILLPLFFILLAVVPGKLPTRILIALILGAIAGLWLGQSANVIEPIGKAFIRLIKMVVVLLVFASLLVGTASLGDIRKLGRIGSKALIFFVISTIAAIIIGLSLANIFQPGRGLSETAKAELIQNYGLEAAQKVDVAGQRPSITDVFLEIIPQNPLQSMVEGNMLQVIFFAMFIGVAVSLLPKEKMSPVIRFFEGLNDIMIKIVEIVIKVAPYGVFALLAGVIGQFGVNILTLLLKYTVVTVIGLLILYFLYPLVVYLLSKVPFSQFLKGILPAQGVAFSTSSSAAALPVMIENCEENIGVSNKIASFVLPLGTTINMDGTALYQGVSALFIAQVFGIHLGIVDQLTIVLTALLASIGTAGVPAAGMLMLVIVLKQIGIPLEGIALILGVERILDMFRTVINVSGDAACAVYIASSEGELRAEATAMRNSK